MACGYNGKGRLCSLDTIYKAVEDVLECSQKLKGRKVVITSGGTIEDIDPVRYISNYSSGKMGKAIADVAKLMGAEVVLITTKDVDAPYKIVKVKSALDMQKAVNDEFETSDIIVMAAAVADYRVKIILNKNEKGTDDTLMLELVKNPDILQELCNRKANSEHKPIIVGFCAESENLIDNAKAKIKKKGCDFLAANDISKKDIGFSSDENEIQLLEDNGTIYSLTKDLKTTIARKMLSIIAVVRNL